MIRLRQRTLKHCRTWLEDFHLTSREAGPTILLYIGESDEGATHLI